MDLVSVPYRGATFLNMAKTFDSTRIQVKFPSPIGELHFSIQLRSAIFKTYGIVVSVPYRGATFLNDREACF